MNTLRLIRFSTTPYACGFRLGARAVVDSAPPPPPPHDRERRAEYRLGVADGRRERQSAA